MLVTASRTHVPKAEAAVESTTAPPPARAVTSRTSFPGPAAVRLCGGNGDRPSTIQIPRSTLPPLPPLRPHVSVAPQFRPVVPTFTVTNFPAPSGSGNAQLTPDVNGLAVDSPVFGSSAEVQATGNVAGWRIGYIQTIFIHFLRDEYQRTNAEWNVPTPIRDALTTNTPTPWYSASSNTSIFRGGPPTFAGMIDRPWHTTNWADPRTGAPNSLVRSSRRLMLGAWLIARNDVSSQIIFLKNVRWEINFIVNVDRSRPFANRAVNAGPGMSAPVVGEGQGTLAPTLTGTIYNDALNNASSRRLSPRAASPALDSSPPSIRLNRNTGASYPSQPIGAIASGAGAPLPPAVQLRLGQQFSTDLGTVRVHTNSRAQQATRSLSARALTYGNHIFLGPGEQPTDLRLMAHETAHVVQQRGVPSLHGRTIASSNTHEAEAHRAADAVARGDSFTVQQQTGSARVQRLGLSDILDGLAELAANLPGFTLITLIIGRNPINLRRVERNFSNLLRAFMGLIPGGELLFQVLNRYSIVERLGGWVSTQVSALGLSYEYLRERFTTFTDSLGLTDLFNPRGVWQRAENIFAETINRVRSFVSRLIDQAIAWLKETFMQPLSNFCREIPGYTLVTVLLGRDPFTNAPVERSALNVVRAFAEFIPGGTEKVNQLVESRALQGAYAWFIQETTARNLTWARVTGTFTAAWNSLRLEDVLHPIDTLQRMVTMFRPLMTDLVSFAGAALMKLLELIFEAAMGAGGARILAIFKRARETFFTIIRNPVGFLGNLLRAVGQGVRQFMTNILSHLRQGVISWLTGPVAQAGVQMPEQWDLRGIIWFVLQILGLTWTRVRGKLVRLLGDRVVAGLETGFQLLQEIRERGLVQALRDRVTEFFGQLREAALGSIRNFIQQRMVMAGIQQLLSLLSPVGAVIQAIIKTYTTIQFFIQRINQILDLVESVVNSIAAIAAGSIGAAANFIERTMARTIPVILDFLARFIGLGDVGGHVQRTIQGLQARVDQMLDRAVEWIRTRAQALIQRAAGGPPQQRLNLALTAGQAAVNRFAGRRMGATVLRPLLAAIRIRYQLTSLDVVPRGNRWAVRGAVNPEAELPTNVEIEGATAQSGVRGQALALLQRQLSADHTIPEIRAILQRVGDDLRPAGLRRLELGEPNAEGVVVILAEASPILPLASVRRRANVPEGRTVTSVIELITTPQPAATPGQPPPPLPSYMPAIGPFPPVASTASVPDGGEVLRPTRRQPANVIHVATWNTTNVESPRYSRDNEAHAERQFYNWLMIRNPGLIPEITRITIRNISLSPCSMCSPMLAEMLRRIKRTQESSPQGLKLTDAHIWWSEAHSSSTATTWPDIRALSGAGWTLHAGANAWPQAQSFTQGRLIAESTGTWRLNPGTTT